MGSVLVSDVLQRAIEYSERHYTVLGSVGEWLVCGTFAAKIGATQIPELDFGYAGKFLQVLGNAKEAVLWPVTVEPKRHARWDHRFCAARMTDVGVEVPEPVFGLTTLFHDLALFHRAGETLLIGESGGEVVLLLVGRKPLCQDPPDSSLSKREISRLNKRYPPICQGCGTLVDKTALAVAVAYSDILRCSCGRVLHAPESADAEALRTNAARLGTSVAQNRRALPDLHETPTSSH